MTQGAPGPGGRLTLRLARRDLERLGGILRAAGAEECCGLLVGRRRRGRTRVLELRPAANVAPGDRRRGFLIPPAAVAAAVTAARARGLELVGTFHSHPLGGTEPSAGDARGGWPDTSCLIVASDPARGTLAARSWRLLEGRFVEEAIVVEESG